MTHRFLALPAVLAVTLSSAGALAQTPVAEPTAVHGAKTVGAMRIETGSRPTSAGDIVRQGGFAAAGMARWIRTPVTEVQASAF